VAGNVARSVDTAERAEEFAVFDEAGDGGDDARQASADFLLRLAGAEGSVGRTLQQWQRAFTDGDYDTGQTLRELIDGADVIDVGVGKEDAADGRAKRLRDSEDVLPATGYRGVDEGEAVGFTDQVAVHHAEAGELVGVGRDLGNLHSARLTWKVLLCRGWRDAEQPRLTMLAMAYHKLLSSAEILKTAVHIMEHGDADGISLRAVASALGVKAPSLYRYFPDKDALELAVADEALRAMLAELQDAATTADPGSRFRETAEAYLHFARERFPLYSFIVQNRIPGSYDLKAGKAVWNLLLEAASGVSGQPDDTAAAVATWSFLHGYATLEHSGAFGVSGPKGGLERGLEAFLSNFRSSAEPVRNGHSTRATHIRQPKKPGNDKKY